MICNNQTEFFTTIACYRCDTICSDCVPIWGTIVRTLMTNDIVYFDVDVKLRTYRHNIPIQSIKNHDTFIKISRFRWTGENGTQCHPNVREGKSLGGSNLSRRLVFGLVVKESDIYDMCHLNYNTNDLLLLATISRYKSRACHVINSVE